MKIALETVLYLVLFLLSLLILFFVYFFRPKPATTPTEEEIGKFLDLIEHRAGFSKPQPISGPRGHCLDYTFPAEISQEESVVDKLTPLSPDLLLDCLDEDQASLQKVYSKCEREDYCIDFLGRQVPSGEYITFYQPCLTGLEPCFEYDQSYLAAISIGGRCLERIENLPLLSPAICSLYKKEQLWRINRVIPGTLIGNSQGPLVRIYERLSGRCLSTREYPPREGSEVILGNCSPNKGYLWWLFPSLEFSEEIEGEVYYFNSSPQLVWTRNITTFPENLYDFLARERPLSLQLSEEKFLLAPYQKSPSHYSSLRIINYTGI